MLAQVVVVKWIDSTTFEHWDTADAVDEGKLKTCYAFGLLVRQDDEVTSVALLATLDKNTKKLEACSNWVNIPTVNVIRYQVVCELELPDNLGGE